MNLKPTAKFKKELKKILNSGLRVKERKVTIEYIFSLLQENKPIPTDYRDHELILNWAGYRDCHIENDLILIYRIDLKNKVIELARIGTHSELFNK